MLIRIVIVLLAVGVFTAALASSMVTGYQATLNHRHIP